MLNEVIELYLDDIIPNRFQPREKFDEEALRELSTSIKEHGVIQPIIVRKIGEKYEIIAGERRYKASALAGLTKIPAIVRNLDDKEASKVALLENLQRKDLTAIGEARTYQKILELDSMTQEELGRTMGKSQAAIANKLRLLALTDEVQEALLDDQISERHARSLLTIENPNEQVEMLGRVIRGRMTVRELDSEIRNNKLKKQTTLEIEEVNGSTLSPTLENIARVELEKQESQMQKDTSTIPATVAPPRAFGEVQPIIIEEESINPVNQSQGIPISQENNRESSNTNQAFYEQFKLKDAINVIRNIVPTIREKGMKVSVEETDLEGKYQIIINIDKD